MKNILLIIAACFYSFISMAQSPGFHYQGAAKKIDGTVISEKNITLNISILSKNPESLFYTENHQVKTDRDGRFSLIVGGGAAEFGSFAQVNWMNSELYIRTEMDAGYGFESMGDARILPVPVASYALNTVFDYKVEGLGGASQHIMIQGQTYNKNLSISTYMYDLESVFLTFSNSINGIKIEPSEITFIPNEGTLSEYAPNYDYIEKSVTISIQENVPAGKYKIPVTSISESGRNKQLFLNLEVIDASLSKYFDGKKFHVKDYRYSQEDLIEYTAIMEMISPNLVRMRFIDGPASLSNQLLTISNSKSGFIINIAPEAPATGSLIKTFDTLQGITNTDYMFYWWYRVSDGDGVGIESRQAFFTLIK